MKHVREASYEWQAGDSTEFVEVSLPYGISTSPAA